MAPKELDLDNTQGNILGGLNKHFQSFLKFKNKDKAHDWVGSLAEQISTSTQVLQFNAQFKALLAGLTNTTRFPPSPPSQC